MLRSEPPESIAAPHLVTIPMTANVTAKLPNASEHWRTLTDDRGAVSIVDTAWRTPADIRNAAFKTVCGALLRRPGWVRFPSIPAKFGCRDGQDDSHSSGHRQVAARLSGRSVTNREPTDPQVAYEERLGLTKCALHNGKARVTHTRYASPRATPSLPRVLTVPHRPARRRRRGPGQRQPQTHRAPGQEQGRRTGSRTGRILALALEVGAEPQSHDY
jgi:hypothetical protein